SAPRPRRRPETAEVRLEALALVAAGGALGAVARYLVALLVVERLGLESLWATAAVNLLGCAAIGAAVAWFEARAGADLELRLALVVGFLGAFTTFSTFALEAARGLDQGRQLAALGNLLLQPALGLAAVLAARGLVAGWLAD
ncbi:MAG: fluoride efflux transporter CrcB, partial [Planctomycetota bacterium]